MMNVEQRVDKFGRAAGSTDVRGSLGALGDSVASTDADEWVSGLDGMASWWWSGAVDDINADELWPAPFRPLFEEPSDAFERENSSSGSLAFVVGGMALPTMAELADQYVLAAGLLVDSVLRGDCEDYLVPNPVLFLHRHALELRLKWLMGEPARTHDLDRLVRDLASPALAGLGVALPEWLERRLAEFAAIDPGSTSFRYARIRAAGIPHQRRCPIASSPGAGLPARARHFYWVYPVIRTG